MQSCFLVFTKLAVMMKKRDHNPFHRNKKCTHTQCHPKLYAYTMKPTFLNQPNGSTLKSIPPPPTPTFFLGPGSINHR